ncbi:Ig-like domain-containing protein [Brevibacillus fortis]|uniref:Ig-like domain-containing protein n=1 Tax=Brevibacillus fortis TaxID=2126352 RepID=UPI0038FCE27D
MAYVWEYVQLSYAATTANLAITHKYQISTISSNTYGISIYGTSRATGQEELLFKTDSVTMNPLDVSGATYSSVRTANANGATTGLRPERTVLTRMSIATGDKDNPFNVWEYIKWGYTQLSASLASSHRYRIRTQSSYSYGISVYGTSRASGQEELLFKTDSVTMTPLDVSGATYSSIRIAISGGSLATGLFEDETLFVRMPLNSPPVLTLTSPANNQTFARGDIQFQWSGSDPDSDSLTYTFQVGTSPGSSNIFNLNVGSETSKKGEASNWVILGTYYWRVIANDGKGGVTTSAERTFVINNTLPTISVTSPANNQILTEGNAFTIAGSATDTDNGNVVTIKYKINSGTERALHSSVSDGSSPISFSKGLSHRGGQLYDGSTDVSVLLAEGTTHTLSIWAVDDKGGTSAVVTRSFTVKHNKAPALTVDAFTPVYSGLIPPDSLTLSGTVSEPDSNSVTVKGKLNNGSEKTLLSGVSTGNWSFPFKISELQAGPNTLTITATDQFGSASVKSFSINNSMVQSPLKKAVARYKIIPPRGSAKEILAWLKREEGDLVVGGEASFVDAGQPEQYVSMSKNSIDLTSSISEDELLATVSTAKSNLTFKLTFSRSNTNSVEAATMMVGVIE